MTKEQAQIIAIVKTLNPQQLKTFIEAMEMICSTEKEEQGVASTTSIG